MAWDIRDKTILLTGATDGIGKAVALDLAKRGVRLVLLSRDKARGEAVVSELKNKSKNQHIEMVVCNLAQMSSVAACAQEIIGSYPELHVVIHCAGVLAEVRKEQEGIEQTMAVNYFAPVLLTELLLPLLKRSAPARVIAVTSSMHKYGVIDLETFTEQIPFEGEQAYSNSKLALMLYCLHVSRELAGSGVTVSTVHPGWIRTKLATALSHGLSATHLFNWLVYMRSPSRGAESVVYVATTEDAASTHGAYIIKKRVVEPKPVARDTALAEALVARTKLLLRDYLTLR
jgi:NAD(P)-dependent dehydrogenase (short-subunit alcohol dehydrogenase family)